MVGAYLRVGAFLRNLLISVVGVVVGLLFLATVGALWWVAL